MPVIPYADESQRLVPGSPVPIGGEAQARMQGEAVAGLGKAMFDLGDALDVAAKRAKNEKDKLDEMEAYTLFRKEQQKQFAIENAAGLIPDDSDGTKSVGRYQQPLNDYMDVISNSISDETVRRKFQIRAADLTADTSMQVLADNLKKRTEDNTLKRGKIISNIGDSAKDDPSNLGQYLAEAQTVILKDDGISEAARPEMANKVAKGILHETINEQVRKGQISGDPKYFSQALKLLDDHGAGLFDNEDRKKQMDDIFTEQYKTDGRLLQKENLRQKQAEKQQAQVEAQRMGMYSDLLTKAGNSDVMRDPVVAQIEKDVLAGNLKEEKGRALIGSKVFADAADDKYAATLLGKTFTKGTYKEAIDQVNKDRGILVSNDRATKLLDDLNKYKERADKNPMKTQLIQDGEELLKSYMQDSINDPLSGLEKRAMQAKVDQTVQQYHKALLQNPDADPQAISHSLYERNYRTPLPPTGGRNSVFDTSSKERTDNSIKTLLEQYSSEKATGPVSNQRENYYKEQFQILNRHSKKFIKLDPLKPISGQQGTGDSTATGARGK